MNLDLTLNDHFEDFVFDWNYKYYFLVGGYGSSKSYHCAQKIILKLLEEKRTCLVVREVFETIRDSCFSLFEEIVTNIGISKLVRFKTSPMRIEFFNGSKIIFKGVDKPEKLKSLNGVSIIWLEECSEIKYAGFKELVGRLRHKTMSNHIICSTNPVSKTNWVYKYFFKDEENDYLRLDDEKLYKEKTIILEDTYYNHSVCTDNYFLPSDYIKDLDKMKEYDKDLYRIARLGQFGVNGTKVLEQFEVMKHEEVLNLIGGIPKKMYFAGMDFGFQTSYNALLRMAVDESVETLYIFWEYYKRGQTDDKTAIEIKEFADTKELIIADCSEPKTIKYYQQQGFKMIGCKKFAGSRLQNIKKIKRFKKIICSDICKNTINELKNLTYKVDKNGDILEDEFNIDPHTLFAIIYGLDKYEMVDIKYKYKNMSR